MKYYTSLFLIVLFLSCGSKINTPNLKTTNDLEILTYLEKNKLKAQKTRSGLYYIINKEGKGKTPHRSSTITAYYKGFLLNGKVFDKSDFRGITFNLQRVIAGWKEGFTYLKSGSEATLILPSHLGYGKKGTNGIPGGAVLIFDIKLLNVQ